MVLTDKDFGRAYLTENDGWARRFLVELFSNYTVLFVGYSHDDTIMTYLGRALPTGSNQKRFSLVGSGESNRERWQQLGIEPLEFPQSDDGDFESLNETIRKLADYMQRGILDWQAEIGRIVSQTPPLISGEETDVIDYALNEVTTTRFFTNAATSPEWVEWLEQRGYLGCALWRG